MVKGVILDMDGLMLDTERLSTVMWVKTGNVMKVPITERTVDTFRGRNSLEIGRTLREAFGQEFDYPKAKAVYTDFFNDYIDENGVPVKKGLTELLEYLKGERIPAAVATSSSQARARKMLCMAGVFDYFTAAVYGDTVEKSKPHPDIFIKAACRLKQKPQDCLVLEDSISGVEAGRRAGGYIIHIPDIIVIPDDLKAKVNAQLDSLLDVIGWIKSENAQRGKRRCMKRR